MSGLTVNVSSFYRVLFTLKKEAYTYKEFKISLVCNQSKETDRWSIIFAKIQKTEFNGAHDKFLNSTTVALQMFLAPNIFVFYIVSVILP